MLDSGALCAYNAINNNQGTKQMTEELEIKLSSILYAQCCGTISNQKCKKQLADLGFTTDLRQTSYIAEVIHTASGNIHEIEI